MTVIADIREFSGVCTNADVEDIKPGQLVSLKNLRPVGGTKLIKTFGFGSKISTAVTSTFVRNIITYVEEHLTNPTDYRYFIVLIDASNKVSVRYWDSAVPEWKTLTLSPDYYHKTDINPILMHEKVIRFLPGNVGEAAVGHESKGIWYGYIDRKFFDELFTPASNFYVYATNIDKFALTVTPAQISGGTFNPDDLGDDKYYKFSYMYDGIQESLLNDSIRVDYEQNKFGKFNIFVPKEHNKRITSAGVYRSDTKEGDYSLIHSIDFMRKADAYPNDSSGGYSGYKYIHCEDLSAYSFGLVGAAWQATHGYSLGNTVKPTAGNANGHQYKCTGAGTSGETEPVWPTGSGATVADGTVTWTEDGTSAQHWIEIDNAGMPGYKIEKISGTGRKLFKVTSGSLSMYWDKCWDLWIDNGTGGYLNIVTGSDNCYSGVKTVFVNEDLGVESLVGEIVLLEDDARIIDNNKDNNIHFKGDSLPLVIIEDVRWKVLKTSVGLYKVIQTIGLDYNYTFFDTGLLESTAYPFPNVESIKVNGKFAKIIQGRLFQANVVLDPGDKNEVHNSAFTFSELNQIDVTPIDTDHIMFLPDREGGEITGLAEQFGSAVFFKKYAIFKLIITNPAIPSSWKRKESVFNAGNVAPQGVVECGNMIYFCSVDGIYRLVPNFESATDDTPLIKNRISEPINDLYLGLSVGEKAAIKGIYNQKTNEIKWFFTNEDVWAFNIITGNWREIGTSVKCDLVCLDEETNVLVFNKTDKKVYSSGKKESVAIQLKTKTFSISDIRKEIIRLCNITYQSGVALTVNLRTENKDAIVKALTLVANSKIETKKLSLKYRAMKFNLELLEGSNSTNDVEIDRMKIEGN